MGVLSLRRDQVIASLLVTGVVVVVGYASGLGLRTTASPGQVAASPAPVQQPAPPETGGLPEAAVPPAMPMLAETPPANTLPTDTVPADGVPTAVPTEPPPSGGSNAPVVNVAAPGVPAPPTPAQPSPTQPALPGQPAPAPSACLPGIAQSVADTANAVVGGLPVVSTLTGSLGVTQSPDGSSPGSLNTMLYGVTGYCPTPAPSNPVPAVTSALPLALPVPVGG